MNIKSKSITEEISPVGQKLMYEHDVLFSKTKHLLITLLIIDFIAAFLVTPVIIEGDFTLNLLGFTVVLEQPFWAIVLYIAFSSILIGLIIFIYALLGLILSAIAESLNNKHRTVLLNKKITEQNQQIIKILNDINNHTDESKTAISK